METKIVLECLENLVTSNVSSDFAQMVNPVVVVKVTTGVTTFILDHIG